MNTLFVVFCFAACFSLITDLVFAKPSYYGDVDDRDLDTYMELLRPHQSEKRGWCRPGFTMNPVINRCVPTMRALIQGRNFNRFRRFGTYTRNI